MQSLTLVDTKPPHKSNTSSYQLMYVGPHSKNRKKIHKSILNLGWNGMCPTETVHLDKVFQRSACQSHFSPEFGHTRGMLCSASGEVANAANTHSFVVVFMGLTKPLAFPDLPCQSCVYHSFGVFLYISLLFAFTIFFLHLGGVGGGSGRRGAQNLK